MDLCVLKEVGLRPQPISAFVCNNKHFFVFTDAGDLHVYSVQLVLMVTVHVGITATQAVFTDLFNIAIASPSGLFLIDVRTYQTRKVADEAAAAVTANRFENYKGLRFYYACDRSIYEHRDGTQLVFKGCVPVTCLLKDKRRLIFGDESGKIGVVKERKIDEIIIEGKITSIAKITKDIVVATTAQGCAYVIDLEKGVTTQTIRVRDTLVIGVVKDGALYFIGRDSRLVCYKHNGTEYVKGPQTDAHYSEATCLGIFDGSVVSAGRDAIFAVYSLRGDTLLFKKFYPTRRNAVSNANLVAIDNRTSIDFYVVGSNAARSESQCTAVHEDASHLFALDNEALECAKPREISYRYIMKLLPDSGCTAIAISEQYFAYATVHKTRLYRHWQSDGFHVEHQRDIARCLDLVFFGDFLVYQDPHSVSFFSLTALEVVKKIEMSGYERMFVLGDFLVFSDSRIVVDTSLGEGVLNFEFKIIDACAGKNTFFLSRISSDATYVLTKFDLAQNTAGEKRYINDVHEVRSIAEFGGFLFFCSSSSLYFYSLEDEFRLRRVHLGELIYRVLATKDYLTVVHDDWSGITKGFERAAEKKKYLKK